NRDAVHVRVALVIQTVLQAQRTELFLAQFARQTATNLVGVLRDAFIDDGLVVLIVLVHSGTPGFVFVSHDTAFRLRRASDSYCQSALSAPATGRLDASLIC